MSRHFFTPRLLRVGPMLLGVSSLALASLVTTGCQLGTIPEADKVVVEDPGLDPQSLYETNVEPQLKMSCSCHTLKQDAVEPFLSADNGYQTIKNFAGGKFLTANPDASLLLQKGKHLGPSLTQEQYDFAHAWLDAESVTSGKGAASPTSPTVALRIGDFYINLESLTKDPLSKITFSMAQSVGRSYRISNLQLTAGPTGGIQIKHPRFIIFTASGVTPESSDGLSTVDLTVDANKTATIGSGSLLLTNLPATSARMALAFEIIKVVNGMPVVLACKNLVGFDGVKPTLTTCAALCHSPTATDTRKAQATGAFNMANAASTDPMLVGSLCVNTLARLDKVMPDKSVLVVQAQPAATGGTPNHPYKLDNVTTFTNFKTAVTTWASGEK